ncbi:replication initiation factor domain-containing protein [Cylindrospermum sp. FACHB-282]|uniref:replication initiation factor domain-containing protein n=1 Tax=Cylindrospermum sp. FACHB-282 TaxID=2692794 RepID=UPI001684C96A|nr:replication initiation factor domain-containing protein [Cylindrospermum sp. FACHB-282]MBD2386912.1 replication initiation factor domain-containing protein [Cylindrospermum sp. FACHB-282]
MTRFSSTVHWLQGTFNFDSKLEAQNLIKVLASSCQDEFAEEGSIKRGVKFSCSFRSTRKIILAVNYPILHAQGYGWLSIPGGVFDAIEFDSIKVIFETLSGLKNWKCTRIDCALDDLMKKITPRIVYQEALRSNFSGFRNKPVFDEREQRWRSPSYSLYSSLYTNSDGNSTEALNVDFGSRTSNKSWHCYDKTAQSDGEKDCTRMEVRFRDENSHKIFDELLTCLNDKKVFYLHLGQIVAGAICFVDRTDEDKHLSRLEILDFWQELLDEIGSVKYPVPKKEVILENSVEWAAKQWETTLAILYEVCGLENVMIFCTEMIANGQSRLEDRHKAIVKKAKLEGFDLIKFYNLINSR